MSVQVGRTQELQQFTQLELLDALVRSLPLPGDSCGHNPKYDGETILSLLASAVRQKHNESCPINRMLPNELLAEIFLHLPARSTHRVVASQTCRHWRGVALLTPRLWADVDFTHTRRAAIFLKRSKSAPLFVTLYAAQPSNFEVLYSHSDRIHNLDLGVGAFGDQPVFVFPFAPNLRQLSIRAHGRIDATSVLPILFSTERTPQLEKLTLRHAFVPWDCSIFSGLKCLTLEGTRGNTQPSIHEIQIILQNNPNLELFQLTTNEPLARCDTVWGQNIHLPNMKQLKLHCSRPGDVRALHSSVDISPNACVTLQSTFTGSSLDLCAIIQNSTWPSLKKLSLHLAERGRGVRIQGSAADGTLVIDIRLDCPTPSVSASFCVTGLDRAISVKEIETFEIRSQRCPLSILPKMERLQTLVFDHVRDIDSTLEGLTMPNLHRLTLHRTDVSGECLLAVASANELKLLDCRFTVGGPFEPRIVQQIVTTVPSVRLE